MIRNSKRICKVSVANTSSPIIVWDVDNVHPGSLKSVRNLAQVLVEAVKKAADQDGQHEFPLLNCKLYANERSLERIGVSDDSVEGALEEFCHPHLVVTRVRKQSVDVAMRQEMIEFAKKCGPNNGVIACVSDDSDFIPTFKYCRSLGCKIISIGRHSSHKRPSWMHPRKLSTLPLVSAAGAGIALLQMNQFNRIGGADDQFSEWKIVNSWFSSDFIE